MGSGFGPEPFFGFKPAPVPLDKVRLKPFPGPIVLG
jgi:hypothetical protein